MCFSNGKVDLQPLLALPSPLNELFGGEALNSEHFLENISIVIATASTGLAATLLPGERTVHSTFKVPLNIINAETPSCSIKKGTVLSRVLQKASVLIVDKATLLHRKAIEAIDTTLKDIR